MFDVSVRRHLAMVVNLEQFHGALVDDQIRPLVESEREEGTGLATLHQLASVAREPTACLYWTRTTERALAWSLRVRDWVLGSQWLHQPLRPPVNARQRSQSTTASLFIMFSRQSSTNPTLVIHARAGGSAVSGFCVESPSPLPAQ